jgi:2-keto-4-pentenoate hydratase/2-oxohepta-3-ene-1,7-dioic acid hydratase in catechol pathway
MRLVTFSNTAEPMLGIIEQDMLLNVAAAAAHFGAAGIPGSMLELIASGPVGMSSLRGLLEQAEAARTDPSLWMPASSTTLLAPIPRPAKNVFCVGRNYKLHIEEGARARGVPVIFPAVPEYFSKPPTAVIGPDACIRLDSRLTQQLDYEVELALIIGRKCRELSVDQAMDAVFGYTVLNDISARDLQKSHNQWFKGKGLDTYCPFGPSIVTADEYGDPSGKRITLRVNGKIRQDSNTRDLLFNCATIVSVLSAGLTLEPGDIIATGTPSGVALGMTPQAWLVDCDVVEAEVEGIGILRNTVRNVD